MFAAPAVLDHDGWVEAARAAVARVSAKEIEAAFLTSLTSRRLDLRSALASYVVARGLPEHSFTARSGSQQCAICGLYAEAAAEDLNVLNFERFKWAGVRRDSIVYVAFDLQQFLRAPRPEVRTEDADLGRTILDVLNNFSARDDGSSSRSSAPVPERQRGRARCSAGHPGSLRNPRFSRAPRPRPRVRAGDRAALTAPTLRGQGLSRLLVDSVRRRQLGSCQRAASHSGTPLNRAFTPASCQSARAGGGAEGPGERAPGRPAQVTPRRTRPLLRSRRPRRYHAAARWP